MHDIDFLPAEYHQQNAKRQGKLWSVLAVVCLGFVLAASAFGQYRSYGRVKAELDAVLPQHATAVTQSEKLTAMQAELKAARSDAELFTYLRFPWPRSRILAGLLKPLPEAVHFEQLEISDSSATSKKPSKRMSKSERQTEEEKLDSLSLVEQDLNELREKFDSRRTVVTIFGTASENAALHKYLGELNRDELFTEATLNSIETDDSDAQGTMRFSATVVVRPGYGQPNGPEGKAKTKDKG